MALTDIVLMGILLAYQSSPEPARGPEPREPQLAQELRKRVVEDQNVRQLAVDFLIAHKINDGVLDELEPKAAAEFQALQKRFEEVDRQNLKWLKAIVARHGWPGKSLVGGQGAKDAWILVQHADHDREFQQQCLDLMEALPKGEVDPRDVGYLIDRVLVGAGKKQKYGTQIELKGGKAVPKPIENEAEVDARRQSIGMEPLSDYLRSVEKAYTAPK
jgi:hypothetical protein